MNGVVALSTYANIPLPEVMIYPHRLLSAETTEKLLNRIYEVPHVRQVNLSGEGLPTQVNFGPHTGLPMDHPQRRTINVKGREVELELQVGRIFVEIDDIDHLQGALDEIEEVCQEILTFGFSLEVGRYSKYKPTIADFRKDLK